MNSLLSTNMNNSSYITGEQRLLNYVRRTSVGSRPSRRTLRSRATESTRNSSTRTKKKQTTPVYKHKKDKVEIAGRRSDEDGSRTPDTVRRAALDSSNKRLSTRNISKASTFKPVQGPVKAKWVYISGPGGRIMRHTYPVIPAAKEINGRSLRDEATRRVRESNPELFMSGAQIREKARKQAQQQFGTTSGSKVAREAAYQERLMTRSMTNARSSKIDSVFKTVEKEAKEVTQRQEHQRVRNQRASQKTALQAAVDERRQRREDRIKSSGFDPETEQGRANIAEREKKSQALIESGDDEQKQAFRDYINFLQQIQNMSQEERDQALGEIDDQAAAEVDPYYDSEGRFLDRAEDVQQRRSDLTREQQRRLTDLRLRRGEQDINLETGRAYEDIGTEFTSRGLDERGVGASNRRGFRLSQARNRGLGRLEEDASLSNEFTRRFGELNDQGIDLTFDRARNKLDYDRLGDLEDEKSDIFGDLERFNYLNQGDQASIPDFTEDQTDESEGKKPRDSQGARGGTAEENLTNLQNNVAQRRADRLAKIPIEERLPTYRSTPTAPPTSSRSSSVRRSTTPNIRKSTTTYNIKAAPPKAQIQVRRVSTPTVRNTKHTTPTRQSVSRLQSAVAKRRAARIAANSRKR